MSWMTLIKIDADIDLTSQESLFGWFATKIAARDGALDMDEAEEAVYAMGLANQLVGTFSQTEGYRATGTQVVNGMAIVYFDSDVPPQTFKWLFDSVNLRYSAQWEVMASQSIEQGPTGVYETVDVLDEQGQVIGTEEREIVGHKVWRPVPQSILPWLAPYIDENDVAHPRALTPTAIGAAAGTEWVLEEVV